MSFIPRVPVLFVVMLGASGCLSAADSSGNADNSTPYLPQRAEVSGVFPPDRWDVWLLDPKLKASRQMVPLPRNGAEPRPTFISAWHISGRNDVETVAQGQVELRRIGSTLTCDALTYRQNDDQVEAVGNVRLTQNDDLIVGPRLQLKLEDNVGFFEEPQYTIKRATAAKTGGLPGQLTTGSGRARRIDFEGENQYRLTDATYSTCAPGNTEWYARAGSMKLDYDRETGEARDATLVFKDVPILYAPWFGFSLNNQRKSGLLSPTLGTTSKGGIEMTMPYFWNIAPDMDMTVSPRVMAKRGVQWNGEFRYLDPNYNGISRVEYLPDDLIAHRSRSSMSVVHAQNFGNGFTGNLNLNNVSDDSYFSDLSSRITNIAQNNLLRQGDLSYTSSWWNASVIAQRFQTLQDPELPPVGIPYHRLPQVTLNAFRGDLPLGAAFNFNGEYVNFSHPTLPLAQRSTLYPQFWLPLQTAAFYVTPKFGLHLTHYSLDRQAAGTPDVLTREVPTYSIDSGVFFERNTDWFGQNLTQTLEPRFYYLYVPNRDQSLIPVFDTGLADFNFAQIFSDNRYVGNDRIADANQATIALTSRLIDPLTGSELLRGMVGQRYYFKAQEVSLPGEILRTSKTADLLAAVSGKVWPNFYLDSGWQFNPHDNRTNRLSLAVRYQPELGKVISAGYRYNRDLLNPTAPVNQISQIDVTGQWPLTGGWSGVGRYNYSLDENRIIEAIGGLEYNAGCWAMRFVVQRIATAAGKSNSAFFVQLELNGFSNIGSNPLEMLKRNIPGYGRINQPVADPIFAAD
ncbi:MAG: LPS-assembly protein LptD [Proteobacteria bacterium]|nr:LPS-assembly protein LptD [Pseudomonadota bacterium]